MSVADAARTLHMTDAEILADLRCPPPKHVCEAQPSVIMSGLALLGLLMTMFYILQLHP